MAARVPRQVPDFRLETLDNEILLYHPTRTSTVYLNETASLIWKLCDGSRSVDDIIELLREAFPDAADTIDADVDAALDQLARHDAVQFV